jgi:hypothetical protein
MPASLKKLSSLPDEFVRIIVACMEITKTPAQRRAEFDNIVMQWPQARTALKAKKNVQEVGIGYREVNGQPQEVMAFIAYVDQKGDQASPGDAIPPDFNGIPVDVQLQQASVPVASEHLNLRGGMALDGDNGIGTLGCFAWKAVEKKFVLLSSHHVLYGKDRTHGEKVFHPNKGCSLCCVCNDVALNLDGEYSNGFIDAAIAEPGFPNVGDRYSIHNKVKGLGEYTNLGTPGELLSEADALLRGTAIARVSVAENRRVLFPCIPGDRMRKVGNATGRTIGIVTAVAGSCSVDYGGGNVKKFFDQLVIRPKDPGTEFARKGDSGAVIVDDQNRVVGLLMSSTEGPDEQSLPNDTTWANNIHNVLERFGLEIMAPPKAEFTITKDGDGKSSPLTVHFDAASATTTNGTIAGYYWDLDDFDSDLQHVTKQVPAFSHTFTSNKPKTFYVRLTVVNSLGFTDFAVKKVEVNPVSTPASQPASALVSEEDKAKTTAPARPHYAELSPMELLQFLKDQMEASQKGRKIASIIERHNGEVLRLVNKNRKVKVIWQRKQGPAFVAQFFRSVRTPGNKLPRVVNGIEIQTLLQAMALALEEEGSQELSADVEEFRLHVFNAFEKFDTLESFLASLKPKKASRGKKASS